jgi:hypothetical protein
MRWLATPQPSPRFILNGTEAMPRSIKAATVIKPIRDHDAR